MALPGQGLSLLFPERSPCAPGWAMLWAAPGIFWGHWFRPGLCSESLLAAPAGEGCALCGIHQEGGGSAGMHQRPVTLLGGVTVTVTVEVSGCGGTVQNHASRSF